jgi:hypothetical protein
MNKGALRISYRLGMHEFFHISEEQFLKSSVVFSTS